MVVGVQLIVSIFIENEMYEMMLWKKKKDFYFNDEKGKHKILDKSVNYLEEISFKMFKRFAVLVEKNYVWIACASTWRSQRMIIAEKSWICQSLTQIMHTTFFSSDF